MDIVKLLDNVLELPGMDGLCLLDADGRLRLNRLPAFIHASALAAAQAHLLTLQESAQSCLPGTEDLVLRFAEHWLMLRSGDHGTLVLLGSEQASLSSVRMVSNIALRQLNAETLAALPSPEQQHEPTHLAPAATRAPRMYRGRPY